MNVPFFLLLTCHNKYIFRTTVQQSSKLMAVDPESLRNSEDYNELPWHKRSTCEKCLAIAVGFLIFACIVNFVILIAFACVFRRHEENTYDKDELMLELLLNMVERK